jgi:integrase
MPRINKELSALEVKRLGEGIHFVGGIGGLTLQVAEHNPELKRHPASWVLRVYVGGIRRNLGLGSYPEVSLSEARQRAREIKAQVALGTDPVQEKAKIRAALRSEIAREKTFKECSEAFIAAHAKDYDNPKHAKQWETTVRNYAYPVIGSLLVRDLTLEDVLLVLKPMWGKKTETAKRLQGRIEKVIDFAISSGYRTTINPARWKGNLSLHLSPPSKIAPVKNFDSLPYRATPDFIKKLRNRTGPAARALEFLVLTAVRSNTVRQATWDEVDLDECIWSIPAANTKTRKPHRVPLSDEAVSLIRSLPKMVGSKLIFPSPRGKVISDMTMNQVIRRMREDGEVNLPAVPHGFRSTFKVWATEQTDYPSELTEICLMHKVGDAVYEAYQRSDMFEKRRGVMQSWSDFLYSQKSSNVSKLDLRRQKR